MIRIKNLSKTYKHSKKAVDNLSLTIERGDIYGFIGHNGAGKTTTLKCVAGILDFEEGEILIDNKSIRDDPIGCKSVMAYIPDNPDLYENLTGIQFLVFVADVYGVDKHTRERLIEKYACEFEIMMNLGDQISSYSHGMKQKLAIISALIHSPKVLILDEPFVGLDPKASHILKGYLKEICGDGGAIFFSTHVLEVAEKLCNKIAIIKNGKLIESGITENVVGNSSLENLFLELIEK